MTFRLVSRRTRTLAWIDYSHSVNPHAESAWLTRLQDDYFDSYLQGLHEFMRQIFPYYRVPVNADPDLGPPLEQADELYIWASSLFQSLVIAGAALEPDEVGSGKDFFSDLVDDSPLPMLNYPPGEAKLIINKLFYQVMYNQGFVDEINYKLRIPAFRYRMKNGQNLRYSPSFPLHVYARQLIQDAGFTANRSARLVENFCIFLWNMSSITTDKQKSAYNHYMQQLEVLLRQQEKKHQVRNWLESIQQSIREILPAT